MHQNPFTYGNPIRDSARFFGRKEEINQIVSRLLSSAHESTSLVGERRIGKTSLLKYLADPAIADILGLSKDKFCLVYIDFQGLTDITAQKFWKRVLKKMHRTISAIGIREEIERLLIQNEIDLFDLEDLFELINDEKLYVVLLMDEFEYVTLNPNLNLDFFGGLRALAIHYSLSLVPATRRELVDLCHSEDIKGSPFFNIFATVFLRSFTWQETKTMIESYTIGLDHKFSDQEVEFVMNLGGGYPLFTQMAGNFLFDGKVRGLHGNDLYEWAIESFSIQADDHFKYFWSHASESEKITLLAVVSQNQGKKKRQPTEEHLVKLYPRAKKDIVTLVRTGMLIQYMDYYKIFSPSFQQWIGLEVLAIPGEEESTESVEEWLNNRGNIKARLEKSLLPKYKKKYWPAISQLAQDITSEFLIEVTSDLIMKLLTFS